MYSPQAETSDVTAEMADATSKAGDVTDIVTGAAPSSTEAASGVFKGGGDTGLCPPLAIWEKKFALKFIAFYYIFFAYNQRFQVV